MKSFLKWTLIVAAAQLFAAATIYAEDDPTLEIRREMLARNNTLRSDRSLKPHRENPALMSAAQDHARWMAKTRVFSHYANGGPGGRATRYEFGAGVLENIGYGYGTVDQAFTGWFNSGGHWANLMSATSDAGFGWSIAVDGTPYWVAVYGTPPGESPPPVVSPAHSSSGGRRRRWIGWIFGN